MRKSQKCHRPELLVKHPAHCFWIPVINGAKEGERKTADQGVVKVRHHEEESVSCQLNGATDSIMPVSPAIRN